MKKLSLSSFKHELHKVAPTYGEKPVASIKNADEKLGRWKKYMIEIGYKDFSLLTHSHELSLEAMSGFSFDELCKIRYSSTYFMDRSIEDLFKTSAQHEIIRKISSSMWRWSYSRGTWNEMVDAYESIRHFQFTDDTDFQIRLDHTTSHNEFGYSKYHRIFLDGVFGFLVYFKGEHVLTIGFSILADKRLLIQQVQSAKRKGNRYLLKLPPNRLEFVIDLFRTRFSAYQLYLVDGNSLVEKTLADYRRQLVHAQHLCEKYRHWLTKITGDSEKDYLRYLASTEEDCDRLQKSIAHLDQDKKRIADLYGKTGRFKLGPKSANGHGLTHYEIAN